MRDKVNHGPMTLDKYLAYWLSRIPQTLDIFKIQMVVFQGSLLLWVSTKVQLLHGGGILYVPSISEA